MAVFLNIKIHCARLVFMKKTIKVIALILVALLVSAAIYLYKPLESNPSKEYLSQKADLYKAEIVRDKWGVPHIKGRTDADASFALAYAHAEDDYQTIQATIAAGRGLLASYQGFDAAPTDYIVNLMDIWGTIDRHYQRGVPDDVKKIAEAYAAGMNLYAAHHPNETWRGLAPFLAEDVVAGFVFKTPFFYGFDQVLLDLFDPARQPTLSLSNQGQQAWSVGTKPRIELGSNAMAISAARSSDNKTRLLINSHQPLTGPVAWYEAHLMSDEGLDISGGLFPGTPVILHGFNRNLGWANTVNHIDLVDVYLLDRNPENAMQYKLDGRWQEFEKEEITIEVKLWGPFRFPAKRTLLRSSHGPVIESNGHAYAVRYAGIDEIRQLEQYYRLNKANTLDEFLTVMSMNALPSINYIYADKESNIGFIHNAQYPQRDNAVDWSQDLPGDDSRLIWQTYRPFEQVPKLINPRSGLIFNANNTPFVATDGQDNLRAQDFPSSMGLANDDTNRSLRFMELNDGVSKLSKDDVLRQKFDDTYSKESKYLKIIAATIALDLGDKPKLIEAQNILKQWNRRTNINNQQTALAVKLMSKIIRSDTPEDLSAERLLTELNWVVGYLENHYGRLDVPWGEVNQLKKGQTSMAVSGGPDVLRAMYAIGFKDNEKPYATNGDSWMALVEWDQNGEQKAQVINQFGSAVNDESSPHFADQMPLFVNQEWRTIESDIRVIKKTASRIYTPQNPQ